MLDVVCNFMRKLPTIIMILVLSACKQSNIRVIVKRYSDDKPKTIRYFNSKHDAKETISIEMNNGVGTVNKPLTFREEGYYENGKLQYRGYYINGQTSGLWEYFYKSGFNEARTYYYNGKSVDTVYCWYSSGKLKRTFIEIDTLKHVWHGLDYSENGNKIIESNLLKDSLDQWVIEGKWVEWHENGQKKTEAIMKNNYSVGKWREWDENGVLVKESEKPFNISF